VDPAAVEDGQGDGPVSGRFAGRHGVWLAWSLCVVALVLYALALLLILLARSEAEEFAWRAQAIDVVGSVGAPVLGGLIASRRPESPIGWMWLGVGLGFALSSFGGSYATYSLGPGSLPAPRTLGTLVAGVGWTAAMTLVPLLLLVFPDGRLPSRRWRSLARTVVAAGSLGLILGPFVPGRSGFAPVENPFGVGGAAGRVIFVLANASVVVVLLGTVLSALSLVFRFRRATGDERQQIKWFAYAAVLFGSLIPLDLLGLSGLFGDLLWSLLLSVTVLGLYAAVGVAILRYRLYDIINRTLVYGALTVTLALVYLGGVVVLQALFRALTGGESTLAVVASTLAIAALFSPLRRLVQGFVDRRFYRKKYDAAKTLETYSARLRDETELGVLQADLVGVVGETMQPEHVSLWLRPAAGEKA
jgi:hypothetical protein